MISEKKAVTLTTRLMSQAWGVLSRGSEGGKEQVPQDALAFQSQAYFNVLCILRDLPCRVRR